MIKKPAIKHGDQNTASTARWARLILAAVCVLALAGLSGCPGFSSGGASNGKSDDTFTIHPELASVEDFLYQLQNLEIEQVKNSGFDMVIMDYSSTGGEDGRWLTSEIQSLKDSGKTVLAYISIGEAEDYRFYWNIGWSQGNPGWLGATNPDWEGNYKVKYWDSDWQDIVYSYLDYIMDQGFDGVYMDIIDGYWYWANWSTEYPSAGENEELASDQEAADRMVDFLKNIAGYCRVTKNHPDFILCPQNGTSIIVDASQHNVDLFWDLIDAVGVEDTFYFGDLDEDNTYSPQQYVLDELNEFNTRKKPIFATEYLSLSNTNAIDRFYFEAGTRGFIPYATSRDLAEFRINPGHEPN